MYSIMSYYMQSKIRNFLVLIILLVIFLPTLSIFPQVTEQQWVMRYDSLVSREDQAKAITVDNLGNVYVTGYSASSSSSPYNFDYLTIKYNSLGAEQWTAKYNGTGNGEDKAESIAVDGSGNVYITGASEGLGSAADYVTVKYNSSGVQQWASVYNGPGNTGDWAKALAIDNSGNVYVTGYSYLNTSYFDYATVKYNSLGTEQWVERYNGPVDGDDLAYAIAVDDSGNVYITGESSDSLAYADYATVKYNSSGVQQWASLYDGGTYYDIAIAIALDNSGNVYVTWESYATTTDYDYVTLRYDNGGVQKWIAKYNGTGNSYDYPNDMVVDGFGNVYVTGKSGYDYATIQYNNVGVQQWVSIYNGTGDGYDEAHSIALDNAGNVYVTGESWGAGSNAKDYATVKYNNDGDEQWVMRYNGPVDDDIALDIAVDSSNSVYVTGYSAGSGTDWDYVTIKYSQGVSVNDDNWMNY